MSKQARVAVVGGGIAGSTVALYLSEIGVDVTLFEKGPSLVNGPPICHLHAGGNLYREISDEQCVTLLRESIDLVRFYPDAIDYRPTVIAVPVDDPGSPQELFKRLKLLRSEYSKLVAEDPANKVLGECDEYFQVFEKEELLALKEREIVKMPKTLQEWMIPVVKQVDLDKVQFPLVMVQEYGINLFRLAASVSLCLEDKKNARILLNHEVVNIFQNCDSKAWCIDAKEGEDVSRESFDFLINAAGFRTGRLDDMIGYKRERFVEFKAAYVSQWEESKGVTWPEVIFYGERGTPRGMAQFTPYPGGYFQLHGMTKEITLFDEGLVKSSPSSAHPRLQQKFIHKIDKAWKPVDIKTRSQLAIEHLSQFIPAFHGAKTVSKPLYGAQQIPGLDESLRAADVSFEKENYARCEIVKASSVLSMADMITEKLIELGYVDAGVAGKRAFKDMLALDEKQLSAQAQQLCEEREYPTCLAHRLVSQSS